MTAVSHLSVQVELRHVSLGGADSHERTHLSVAVLGSRRFHLLRFPSPASTDEVNAWRRTEEPETTSSRGDMKGT